MHDELTERHIGCYVFKVPHDDCTTYLTAMIVKSNLGVLTVKTLSQLFLSPPNKFFYPEFLKFGLADVIVDGFDDLSVLGVRAVCVELDVA
jgi:hypothetical protein